MRFQHYNTISFKFGPSEKQSNGPTQKYPGSFANASLPQILFLAILHLYSQYLKFHPHYPLKEEAKAEYTPPRYTTMEKRGVQAINVKSGSICPEKYGTSFVV